jgi:hypothetical protein
MCKFTRHLLITVALMLVVGPAYAQRDVAPPAAVGVVVVGTATPSGAGFDITLDSRAVDRARPSYVSASESARVATSPNAADFNVLVRSEASRKLKELFPGGAPSGTASRIKISIHIKLSKPPEIGLSIEW